MSEHIEYKITAVLAAKPFLLQFITMNDHPRLLGYVILICIYLLAQSFLFVKMEVPLCDRFDITSVENAYLHESFFY